MAFENAWLSEEEKKKFIEAKLRDPRFSIRSEKYLPASNWTIDRENNVALVYCGEYNRDEYDKKVFALLYKQIDNEHLINVVLTRRYFPLEIEKKWREKYEVNLVEKWKLLECKIPKDLKVEIDNDELYNILSDALSRYGINGHPERVQNVKALLEVEGGKYYDGTGNVKWYNND